MKLKLTISIALLAMSCTTQSCEYYNHYYDDSDYDDSSYRGQLNIASIEYFNDDNEDNSYYHMFERNAKGQLKIAIGRATHLHLDQISQLSDLHYTDLKTLLYKKYFREEIPKSRIDDFVDQTAKFNNKKNHDFTYARILDQAYLHPSDDKQVLVVVAKKWGWGPLFGPDSGVSGNRVEDFVLGYCRFQKINPKTIYIDFVLVAEKLRNRGLARHLIKKAMNTFDGVTEYTFHVPENKILLCHSLKTKGCEEIETVRLDPSTGKISTKTHIPIEHIKYLYTIQSEQTKSTVFEPTTQAISTNSNTNDS